MIKIKTAEEIQLMREAGEILAGVLDRLGEALAPGMSTMEINDLGEELIRKAGAIPSFLDYEGYPASICVSVNEEVVHGIPAEDRIIEEGDIVSLDAGVIWKGYQSDAARSFGIGKMNPKLTELMDVTRESFFAGIKMAKSGNYLHDISNAISDHIRPYGFGIVKQLTGHGIGKDMHEDPIIPNYRKLSRGPLLKPGMTLAIEPMVNLGTWKVGILEDGWTIVTLDGKPSAHYENTVLITEGEPEILSLTDQKAE
ncbi:MAG: type I methionyl aminopeptidase [Lachnospiraceae bacterium]|nr:type I methionyl aminopeptidase [Lachnospiraceae bacterium]